MMKIAIFAGDGIGPEVTDQARRVLETLALLTLAATPPVFDGPEDRNGLRNAAELRFWRHYIEQPQIADAPFVLLGTFNSDLDAGEGHKLPLRALLQHPLLTDPEPTWAGDKVTAHWSNGLQLRVDYVLPSRRLGVRAAKVERTPQTDVVLPLETAQSFRSHGIL